MVSVSSETLQLLLVPGGGGSGPENWDRRWEADDPRVERVMQSDWEAGTRAEWVAALNRHICGSSQQTVLIAHSLGNIVACYWAAQHAGPVIAALLVAPTYIDDEWVAPGSLYERFRPIPMIRLPFPSVLVVSIDDPCVSSDRARKFAAAWGSSLECIGPHGHIGADSNLGNWSTGQQILNRLVSSVI